MPSIFSLIIIISKFIDEILLDVLMSFHTDINTRCPSAMSNEVSPLQSLFHFSLFQSLFQFIYSIFIYSFHADINTRCPSAMSSWSETSSPFASRRRPASSLSALHEQSLVSAQQLHDLRLAAVSGNFCAKCLKSILYIY